MKFKKASPKLIAAKNWTGFLQTVCDYPEVYFRQEGNLAGHRSDEGLDLFLDGRAFGRLPLSSNNLSTSVELSSLLAKSERLDELTSILNRDSRTSLKCDTVISVTEEIILNAFVSAPNVARKKQDSFKERMTECRFVLEWNKNEIWIHGQDPYGVFLRENFQNSFKPTSEVRGPTAGYSGKGLEIILNSCTDLYIKSEPNWGTWVCARMDLLVSSRESDAYPKRLVLDFK